MCVSTDNGNLVLSYGSSPKDKHGTIWESRTNYWWWRSNRYLAELTEEGMLIIKSNNKVLWMNPFSIYPELKHVISIK